jgi:uncharacterized SAM-dependent methyltransferase
VAFLRRLRSRLNSGDRLVFGADLHKDEAILNEAYNSDETCRNFFVHMIRRVNEYMGADFDPRVFRLSSVYQEEENHAPFRTWRMSLRVSPSERQHTWVRSAGFEVQLEPHQPVQVGISRKFEPEGLRALGEMAGLRLVQQWFDSKRWYSLNEFVRS